MNIKLQNVWFQRTFVAMMVVATATGVVACGGGGSDDNDSRGGAIELPVLEGLEGDANNQRRLFFTSSLEGSQGLYAYNPRAPERGAELVDDQIELMSFHFNSIHGGTVKASAKRVEDFHVSQVLYSVRGEDDETGESMPVFLRGSLRRALTDQGPDVVEPVGVGASEESAGVLSQTKRFFHYDLEDPMNTGFVHRSIKQDSWVRVQLDDVPTVEPAEFGKDIEVISWVTDLDTSLETGWLVLHEKDGRRLERVDAELKPVGPVRYKDSGEEVNGVTAGQPVHQLESGEQLLVLSFDEKRGTGELWKYETDGSAGDGGTIQKLLNDDGKPLVFTLEMFDVESGGVSLPAGETSVSHQGAFFFAHGPGMFDASWTTLYRIDAQGWSVFEHSSPESTGSSMDALLYSQLGNFLIDAGADGLIWSLGGKIERVKAAGADVSAWTREVLDDQTRDVHHTVVHGMRDGWIFYNTEQDVGRDTIDIAVALNVRDNQRIVLKNAEWIGASSSGKSSYVAGQMDIELSEVFVLRNGRELAAVSAADPKRGAVILGEFPASTKQVTMYGVGAGPHRLLGVEHEDKKGYEVVYVNTREGDSLVHLMKNLAVDWKETLEYTNFGGAPGSTELNVSGSYTRPLDLF